MESSLVHSSHITASSLLVLVTVRDDDLDPASILGTESWKNITEITTEDVIRQERGGRAHRTGPDDLRNVRRNGSTRGRGNPGGRAHAVIRTNLTTSIRDSSHKTGGNAWKKPSLKPKPTSFDDAMKQKIVSDLNKITPGNYDVILKSMRGICSRLSDDEHPWALRLILENATNQHVFATTYVQLYKDIATDRPQDTQTANDILAEFMESHRAMILKDVNNGKDYDDFCAANKMKTQLTGHSIVLAEAVNMGIIPLPKLGEHAVSLVSVLQSVICMAGDPSLGIPKETTENSVQCIAEFFRTLSKTKADKDGFQKCIHSIGEQLEQEKTDKKLSPKARFALMDFMDDMNKTIQDAMRAKTVYRPGMFKTAHVPP